ncbi:hypothetical protein AGDE_16146 [Angomonas deanei]|uniref:Beta-lactamase n=1 Tax=Angomonas deanei TaxID=59799 RepID=A0A7G2CNF4_9TRYP|nr:hypothetical protein AGDE_16146 [Angomonas deanei]CAD2220617.1 hypothetical protein, conserved [Angomonas deanei]|eukprot:EPY17644.1 hypothetical protein AGDE_16146 [Angomonas deanei]
MKLTSVIFRCVLLFLLICGMGNTASKQTTPTTNMFNYRNASDSFFYNLYNSIQSNPYFNYDRKIFAASMMVRQVGDTFSYNYQFASGTTDNNLNDPLNTVLNRNTNSNNVAEAFAANSFFSQLFLSMVIFDLEYKGLLPFGVVDPIPLDYLPENYRTHMTGLNSNNILFKNMNFPTSSNNINIMSLLQHTSTLTDYYFESQTISKSFEDGADTTQTVPTLDVYVENLFSNQINGTTPANVSGIDVNLFSSPADFANATSAANYCNGVGQVGCYYFAKNNIAVLSYILNQILIATADRNNITATDVNSYSFELLFPLSLSRTFLLTTSGERSFPTYPPVTIKSNIHYFSSIVQNINADGTAINHYVVIHPSYFSDYMLYMSNADISALLGAFFFSRWNVLQLHRTALLPLAWGEHQQRELNLHHRPGVQ